jgi:exodeoxyribonuclease VII small subunit
MTTPSDEPGYAAALAELDAIVRELEGADVDVDHLAERVARAADLVALCRSRIASARLQIDQVVARLDLVDEVGDQNDLDAAPPVDQP